MIERVNVLACWCNQLHTAAQPDFYRGFEVLRRKLGGLSFDGGFATSAAGGRFAGLGIATFGMGFFADTAIGLSFLGIAIVGVGLLNAVGFGMGFLANGARSLVAFGRCGFESCGGRRTGAAADLMVDCCCLPCSSKFAKDVVFSLTDSEFIEVCSNS